MENQITPELYLTKPDAQKRTALSHAYLDSFIVRVVPCTLWMPLARGLKFWTNDTVEAA